MHQLEVDWCWKLLRTSPLGAFQPSDVASKGDNYAKLSFHGDSLKIEPSQTVAEWPAFLVPLSPPSQPGYLAQLFFLSSPRAFLCLVVAWHKWYPSQTLLYVSQNPPSSSFSPPRGLQRVPLGPTVVPSKRSTCSLPALGLQSTLRRLDHLLLTSPAIRPHSCLTTRCCGDLVGELTAPLLLYINSCNASCCQTQPRTRTPTVWRLIRIRAFYSTSLLCFSLNKK